MSGGVDSSVTAALLKEEGYDVIGVTMKLLPRKEEGFGCCGSPDDMGIAKRCAEKIGIPHYVLDYSAEFERDVIQYFVDSYLKGETPNPCLACNRAIKFDRLKTFARTLGATHLATGHYARIIKDLEKGTATYRLFEAADLKKDQSYVLFNLDQNNLSSTLFPLGPTPKKDIRNLAKHLGLPNADKKDSQEICFVPDDDFGAYVLNRIKNQSNDPPPTMRPGPIKDTGGRVLGNHKGIAYYTVGQRKGLGMSLKERYYITRLDAATNTLVVGPAGEDTSSGLEAEDIHWVAGAPPAREFEALVKIRYKHEPAPAHIRVENNKIFVRFATPQRAVTPGQAAVIYRWDESMKAREVLGGGKISNAQMLNDQAPIFNENI
ncbi:MAG: tRNA 2-thiouridine(34) synthase MnmA [Elusimicrobia bacterium]|nr:tRNA 2-thiouridine(34) synthase MnmA [Candidatus Obscuribacterium magneticum]